MPDQSIHFDRYGGPWLCGEFSIADVMYVPVALRFVTYGIQLQPTAQQVVTLAQALEPVQAWYQDAAQEGRCINRRILVAKAET